MSRWPHWQHWQHWQQYLKLPTPLPPAQATRHPRIDAPLLDHQQIQRLYQHAASHGQPAPRPREIANSRVGDQRGQRRGTGMDYDDSRPYHPGDEPRHMNWRLSARSGELQMKRFREERRPTACVLLDRRNRMVFGSRHRLKITQAAANAALTSFAAARRGDQSAALIIQHQTHWIAPRDGHPAAYELARQYLAPRQPASQSPTSEASLQQAITLLTEHLPDGSHLTLISDFADLCGEEPTSDNHGLLAASLCALCSRHQVNAIHIADPTEIQLPHAKLRLSSIDGTPARRIDARDPQLRRAYEHASAHWFSEREQLLTTAGAHYRLCLTTDNLTGPSR